MMKNCLHTIGNKEINGHNVQWVSLAVLSILSVIIFSLICDRKTTQIESSKKENVLIHSTEKSRYVCSFIVPFYLSALLFPSWLRKQLIPEFGLHESYNCLSFGL